MNYLYEDSELESYNKQIKPEIYTCRFIRKSLWFLKVILVRAFVSMCACCSLVGTYLTEIVFDLTNSRMKWNRTSMCLVLAELSGLLARATAPSLSTNTSMQFSDKDGTMKG